MENYSLIISAFSLIISIFVLWLNYKSGKTSRQLFILNREIYRAGGIDLQFVSSEQKDGYFLVKMVFFNPSPIAAIIKSFSVHEKVEQTNFFFKLLNIDCWRRIDDAKWCPTSQESCNEIRSMKENYKDLFFKEHRDILVSIPGWISRDRYRFFIQTNNGNYIYGTSVNAVDLQFSHYFEQCYKQK